MKKRIFLLLCVLGVVVFASREFLYSSGLNDSEKDGIKQIKQEDTISMMLETAGGSGNYELVTQSSWPTDGYLFNETLSKCENGSELSWDNENKLVTMSGNVSDKCYVYFDKIQKAVIDSVTTSDITTTSLTLTINATKGTFDISKYYYSMDNGSTWNESASNVITLSGLTLGTEYTIKFYVQDSKELSSDYKTINASTLISFTVFSKTFYAEEGMTWKEFINSSYNDGTIFESGNYAFDNHYGGRITKGSEMVYLTDKIINGGKYKCDMTG